MRVKGDGVGGQEHVSGVSVQFRALRLVQGVFDGEFVQPEFGVCQFEIRRRWPAKVQPYHRRRISQVLADVGDREIVQNAFTSAVQAGVSSRATLC